MKTLVIYGNCQASAIATTLKSMPEISSRFEVQHHFVSNEDTGGQWKDHIDRLHAIVIQNVANWIGYPYRERLPEQATRIDIPFAYLGSLWPFDCTQNPDDTVARQLRATRPDWDFAYQDSVLARLRTEIPDLEARYRAYVEMRYPDAIDIKRYHAMEAARLRRIDSKLGLKVGEFILEKFRKERLFHTVTHPTPRLMKVFVVEILKKLDIPFEEDALRLADPFSYFQVPVHPRVIEELELEWVDEKTEFQFYERKLSFEEYTRKYIEVYG